MSIVYSDDSDVTHWPLNDLHDIDSHKYYFIDYRPDFWQPSTTYIRNVDLVIPPIANGCMYECISGGISSLTSPTFPTLEGRIVQDSDVAWRTLPFTARLGYGDVISLSTWSASSGVVISDDEIVSGKTTLIKVMSVPSTLCEFDLINIVNINRATGRTETFKKTLRVSIGTL